MSIEAKQNDNTSTAALVNQAILTYSSAIKFVQSVGRGFIKCQFTLEEL